MKPVTSYTRKTLIPGEQILYAGKLHNFCYLWPVVLILMGLFFLFLPIIYKHVSEMKEVKEVTQSQEMQQMQANMQHRVDTVMAYVPASMQETLKSANQVRQFLLGAIFLTFGLVYLFATFLKKISTEQVITNKKIIFKKGFIQVDESEVALVNIEGVKVHQTVMDRLLGRGRVLVNGLGMEQLEIKNITRPNDFRHFAYTAIDKYTARNHQPTTAQMQSYPPASPPPVPSHNDNQNH